MTTEKPWILFISEPERELDEYVALTEQFGVVEYFLQPAPDGVERFLAFLNEHQHTRGPIVGVFGGYPQFIPIGGLGSQLLADPRWPATIRCISLCSRGYNGIDLDLLRDRQIQLYNYDDMLEDDGIVANDVADCVLWHVLEGFRKFSYQMESLRKTRNTVTSRFEVVDDRSLNSFQFGHRLPQGQFVQSPRNKKCLIIGLGRIGLQCGLKLANGLGMEIHYTQRTDKKIESVDWTYHSFPELTQGHDASLSDFHCIVLAVPGTSETYHLLNSRFLSRCRADVVICNVGRGNVIENSILSDAIASGAVRHVGLDVFYREPEVDGHLIASRDRTSITPHIASSTKEVWLGSNRMALKTLCHVCASRHDGESAPASRFSRVV